MDDVKRSRFRLIDLRKHLGFIPDVRGINERGWLTGHRYEGRDRRVFLWRGEGSVVDEPPLLSVSDLNRHGALVGSSHEGACLLREGRREMLEGLGGEMVGAFSISDACQIAGWSDNLESKRYCEGTDNEHSSPLRRAVRWMDGGAVDLGTLGGDNSVALAVNDAGQICGYSDINEEEESHAFRCHGGAMERIVIDGSTRSSATALNSRGEVVGWFKKASGEFGSFLCRADQVEYLPELGTSAVFAHDINSHSEIVGTLKLDDRRSGGHAAFLFSDGEMRDLNTLVGASDLHLASADKINDAGQIVAKASTAGRRFTVLLEPRDTTRS